MTGVDGQPIVFDSQEEAIASPIFQRYKNSSQIKDYQSGHFDEPNILAHMRVNDRMIDGKKSLFVEEIQSDWHQQGRKKGYKTGENIEKQYENLMLDMRKQVYDDSFAKYKQEYEAEPKLRELMNDIPTYEFANRAANTEIGNMKFDDLARQAGKYDEWKQLYDKLSVERNGVPDAPYKKNWQEMAMRRAIQMAVDEGYDRVAFTTGKQQADRYSLSKQVNSIDWRPYESNGATKVVNIMPTNGSLIELQLDPNGVVLNGGRGQFAGKSIDDIIGKEVAKKIMDTPDGDLAGKGLEIGGEGMKGFYDKILPEYVNKYGKKYGIKVGKTKIDVSGGKPTDYADFDAYTAAKEGKGEEIHYFDITPEAKKSLLEKGSPLFAIPPAVEMTDEESRKEMLERLFKENQK
jgi:hypothetical protein